MRVGKGGYLSVVLLVVETDHKPHSEFLEGGHVVVRTEAELLYTVDAVNGSAKGQELVGNDPVHVSVLDLLVVLIVCHVEGRRVVPIQVYCPLQRFQTVRDLHCQLLRYRALVRADAPHRVSVVHELLSFEGFPSVPGRPLQNNHRERPHQVRPVCLFLKVVSAVVVDLRLLVGRVFEQLVQLDAEGVRESEVERTEVFEEGLIHQLLVDECANYRVDTEVVRLFLTLRWLVVAHPVQSTYYSHSQLPGMISIAFFCMILR